MPERGTIRRARIADIERLQDIERAAGAAFVDVGMPEIAADEPLSEDVLRGFIAAQHAWVWVDARARGSAAVAAYVVIELVDGAAHIAQVSVDPAWARQGIGGQLIDHVADWAAAAGMTAVTLTTFRDIPWNAPYYARIGFRVVSGAEIGPQLRQTIEHEAAIGLDPTTRVAMTRPTGWR